MAVNCGCHGNSPFSSPTNPNSGLSNPVLSALPRIECQHDGPVTDEALLPILDTLGAPPLNRGVLLRAKNGDIPGKRAIAENGSDGDGHSGLVCVCRPGDWRC